jgi:hypothetical protein
MTKFESLCKTGSDINEHLENLRDLAKDCDSVVEMGVRYCVSTWAFIEGLKEGTKLTSIDIKHPKEYNGDLDAVEKACKEKGIDFTFIEGDTTQITIDKCDLLFIDTDHTYVQLKKELELHGNKAQKYLAFHDTVSCETELMPAIEEFMKENPRWRVFAHYKNNNGVLVLETNNNYYHSTRNHEVEWKTL